jgi:hypothetical protein
MSSRPLSKNLILPVVLYGCEIWSLSLREKHISRASEKRVLKRIFGLKRGGSNRRMEKSA